MKKELIILAVIIGVATLGFLGFKWFTNSGTKTIVGTTTTEYRDEKFGYRFVYPNTWITKRLPLTPGYIDLFPPTGKPYSFYFWYRDSQAIKTMADLEAFVKDDAAYAEKEQGYKIVKLFPERLGNLEGFAYDSTDKEGKITRAYYVADFTPTPDQTIFVWTVGLISETNALDVALADQEVKDILASYRLLEE